MRQTRSSTGASKPKQPIQDYDLDDDPDFVDGFFIAATSPPEKKKLRPTRKATIPIDTAAEEDDDDPYIDDEDLEENAKYMMRLSSANTNRSTKSTKSKFINVTHTMQPCELLLSPTPCTYVKADPNGLVVKEEVSANLSPSLSPLQGNGKARLHSPPSPTGPTDDNLDNLLGIKLANLSSSGSALPNVPSPTSTPQPTPSPLSLSGSNNASTGIVTRRRSGAQTNTNYPYSSEEFTVLPDALFSAPSPASTRGKRAAQPRASTPTPKPDAAATTATTTTITAGGDSSPEVSSPGSAINSANGTKVNIPKEAQAKNTEWLKKYESLKAFHTQFGHCNVKRSYDYDLAGWVYNNRKQFRNNTLKPWKVRLLQGLDFQFEGTGPNDMWMRRFQQLKTFFETHGHCNVTESHDKQLACFVRHQREYKRLNTLSQERVKLLEDLGFQWRLRRARGARGKAVEGKPLAKKNPADNVAADVLASLAQDGGKDDDEFDDMDDSLGMDESDGMDSDEYGIDDQPSEDADPNKKSAKSLNQLFKASSTNPFEFVTETSAVPVNGNATIVPLNTPVNKELDAPINVTTNPINDATTTINTPADESVSVMTAVPVVDAENTSLPPPPTISETPQEQQPQPLPAETQPMMDQAPAMEMTTITTIEEPTATHNPTMDVATTINTTTGEVTVNPEDSDGVVDMQDIGSTMLNDAISNDPTNDFLVSTL